MVQSKRWIYLILAATLLAITSSFRPNGIFALKYAGKTPIVMRTKVLRDVTDKLQQVVDKQDPNKLIEPSYTDMTYYSHILGNITSHMRKEPEKAMSLVSHDLGWLLARNVTELTNMVLADQPAIRENEGMMQAYLFILDFLDTVTNESKKQMQENQALLRYLLEAAAKSGQELDQYITQNTESLLSPNFLVYLDAEVQCAERDSPAEHMLVIIQLKLLAEQGKSMGLDVALLPQLAAEADPHERRRKTILHLQGYNKTGRKLFAQTLRAVLEGMETRYKDVDPALILNMKEIQTVTEEFLVDNV